MVENPEAEHHVEAPVFGLTQITHIVLDDVHVVQRKGLLHERRLLDMGFAAFDAQDTRAVTRELNRIDPFMARQIEKTKAVQRTPRGIGDNLQDTSQLDFIAMYLLANCVQTAVQMNIGGGPRTKLGDHVLLLGFH